METPTPDQFRAVARLWAEHFGGTVASDAHVRILKSGSANVTARRKSGTAYAHNVSIAEALAGKLGQRRLDHIARCAADAAEAAEAEAAHDTALLDFERAERDEVFA
jgi:hypothetical protein